MDFEQLKEQLAKCQQENDELEKRCKKLMNSISLAVDAREVSLYWRQMGKINVT